MAWPKGVPKGYKTGGRKKGSPRKLVKGPPAHELRDMILGAFAEVGGQKYLVRMARLDPGRFLPLLARLVPTKIEGELGVKVPTTIKIITGFDEGPHQR